MQTLGFFFHIGLLFIFYISSFSIALTKIQYPVTRRWLTTLRQTNPDKNPDHVPDELKVEVDPSLKFDNPRLKKAYCALQEWKKAMISDPYNMTGSWVGPNVCSYFGVGCVLALDDPRIFTVAVVDLNFGDISGQLVPHLGLLIDLGILHLHSNRFCGIVPKSLSKLELLFELDLSNNRFSGPFPTPVLDLPSLRFLDIRFNEFEGPLPPALFDKDLDAIIVNNNRFYSHLPKNMGNSPASALVLANNKLSGCIPRSFVHMPNLEQVSFSNNRLTGCLPEGLESLKYLLVLDVSKNYFVGPLPRSLESLKTIAKLDFSNNQLTGKVHDSICGLPALWNLTLISNFFDEIGGECEKRVKDKLVMEDTDNCLTKKPNQRPQKDCLQVLRNPVDCKTAGCQPRDPSILKHIKKKTPQQPTVHSPTPPKVSPSTPKPPPMPQSPPARIFKNLPP